MITRSLVIGAILGAIVCLAVALAGCAHVTAVADTCKPSADEVVTVATKLMGSNYAATLEVEAISVGLCVVNAAVDQLLSTKGARLDPVVAEHARAWRTAHPG